jgi:predicted nucleic acid-binding protein
VILVDTGPLVAAALDGDSNHNRCVELFTALHLNSEPLVVPSFVVTEVCYLLAREAGPRLEAELVRSLAAGDFEIATLDRRHFSVVRPRHVKASALYYSRGFPVCDCVAAQRGVLLPDVVTVRHLLSVVVGYPVLAAVRSRAL